jgi:oxaloacetate decarboxylase (Na+ extruding) subunit alpha
MKLGFTETVLRDANQSLMATRLPLDKFESILNTMDKAGYYSVECWGGATFDACIRYLDEDPWERLKIIRKNMPNTKLQMLLRGQSLLGYKHYPDDVVRKFIYNAVEKGIDIIRIFDALNDISNIEVAVKETIQCGAHPSCAISYTTSPVHNINKYIELAKSMESIGAQSICIKDMAGVLTPKASYDLVGELKKNVKVPIILHSHCSTGLAYMTYLKAIEAGVDVIDTAVSSFSGGTSQPATEVMVNVAKEMGYDTTVDITKVEKINDHFTGIYDEFLKLGLIDPKVMKTVPKTLVNKIPGGMYSNLIAQMKGQGLEQYLDQVLDEVPNVRKDLGYPPLVTPISQMVGAQATANVLSGERYKTIISEVKAYFRGEYGTPPGPVNEELMMKVVGHDSFPEDRFSSYLEPVYEKKKAECKDKEYGRSDLLTSILFGELGELFIERRNAMKENSFIYKFEECNDSSNIELHKAEYSDEELAVIIAILRHKLGKEITKSQIKKIYEVVQE